MASTIQIYYLTVLEVRHLPELKPRCLQGWVLSRKSMRESVLYPFQSLKAVSVPWLLAFFHLQNSYLITLTSASAITSHSLTLLLLSFPDYIEPVSIIQANLPILRFLIKSPLQSPFCQVRQHSHRLQGLGRRHL